MMNNKKRLALLVGSLFLAAAPAYAVDFTPRVELEGQTYSGAVSGGIGVFLPLVTEAGQTIFLDARQNTLRHAGNQASVGLGYRFLGGHDVVYGANLYGDFMKSSQKNRFSRLSIGLEALGPIFEARANVYLPTGTKERTVSQHLSTEVAADDYLYLQHHSRSEKIRRGADAEMGGRLPVFDASANQQLKGFAGGYWFSDSSRHDLVGAKVRLEWEMRQVSFLPKNVGLSLGAMASYDNQQHLKGGALARISLSLGQTNVAGTGVQDRLVQRVTREQQIRTEQKQSLFAERAADASGKTFGKVVLLDAGSGQTRAATAINQRVAQAGKDALILVAGDVQLNEALILGAGQRLHGGQSVAVVGSQTGVQSQHRFANQAGSLTGLNQAQNVVQMHSDSSIEQLVIKGGLSGIQAQNVNNIKIDQVQIKDSALNGIHLSAVNQAQMSNLLVANSGHDGIAVNQGKNISIEQADISRTGHDGIRLTRVDGAKIHQANIHDLEICDNNTDCEFAVASDPNRVPFSAISAWGSSNLAISNTTITDTTYGVFVGSVFEEDNYGYDLKEQAKNIHLDNVSINNTRREGILLVGANQVNLNKVSVDNGGRQGQEQHEMDLVVLQATSDVNIKDMTLKGGVNGLMLVSSSNLEGETARVLVDGLTTTGSSRAGVFMNPVHDVTFKNVTVANTGLNGITMYGNWSGAVANIQFDQVHIKGVKQAGISASGPLSNINGNVTVEDAPVACEGWADLTQASGQTWTVNGETMSTERIKNKCG